MTGEFVAAEVAICKFGKSPRKIMVARMMWSYALWRCLLLRSASAPNSAHGRSSFDGKLVIQPVRLFGMFGQAKWLYPQASEVCLALPLPT